MKGAKRKRCGQCNGCKQNDCGECLFCKDKPKFGEGKKKQCCVLRKCQALASSTYPLPSLNHTIPSSFMVLTQETPPTSSLSAIGRAVKKIKADGNCFFRAVSFLIAGSENYHLEIRNLIIQFEEMNRGIFETYLLPLTNKPTFEEHLQLLHNPTSWATQTEVLAVATYFRVPCFIMFCSMKSMFGDVSSH